MYTRIMTLAAGLMVVSAGAAVAAPQQLYGKAIKISWSENRVQRPVGETAWQNISNSVDLTYYISSAGRVFRRQDRTSTGAGNQQRSVMRRGLSNTADRGPGDGPTAGVVSAQLSFQGTAMTATARYQSGARLVAVNFDPAFSTCTARVVLGKEGGRNQILVSQITGVRLEVQSVQVPGASCSVQAGNPFGG